MKKEELVKQNKKKVSKVEKEKGIKSEFAELAKVLSGELDLRKKQEEAEKLKDLAIEKHKSLIREGIEDGESEIVSGVPKKVVQKIDLFEWEAPIRTSFNFEMRTFMGIVALSLVWILFLAILGHYMLMLAVIALLFFIYVAGTTEPIKVKHKVTTRGIETTDRLYEWFMLDSFYFTKKNSQELLIVNTKLRVPDKLIMLIDPKDRAAIFVLLQELLLYKDIKKQGRLSSITYGEYIPLEKV